MELAADRLFKKSEPDRKKFWYVEMVDPKTGDVMKPVQIVGYADNFVRLEMVQDTERAICLCTKKDAELFLKYIKKTNGGADCIIQSGLKDV
jgi:hypothetical protein